MADYTSFATTPIATRPYGPIEGIDVADQTMFANQAKMQSLQDMLLAYQMKQAELQRYTGETPGKLAQSQYEGALAGGKQSILPQTLQGLVGAAQQQQATGGVAIGTMGSDIAAKQSDNQAKMTANDVANIANIVTSYSALMEGNPLQAPFAYQEMLQKLPENVRSQFPTSYNPKTAIGLQKMKQALAQTIPHIQNMEKEAAGNKSQEKIAAGNNAATIAAAKQRATMRIKTLAAQFNEALAKGNDEGIIAAGTQLILDPEVLDEDKTRLKVAVEQAKKRFAVKLSPKILPGVGTMPGSLDQTNPILNQLNSGNPGQPNIIRYDAKGNRLP